MRFARTTIAGALLALGTAQVARADDQDSLRSLYTRLGTAVASRDVDGYMALLDPGIVSIDASGHRKDARALRAELGGLVSGIRDFRTVFAFDDVRNSGTRVTALVKTVAYFEAKVGAGDFRPMLVVDASEDAWEVKGGKWKNEGLNNRRRAARESPAEPDKKRARLDRGRLMGNLPLGALAAPADSWS